MRYEKQREKEREVEIYIYIFYKTKCVLAWRLDVLYFMD